MYKELKALKIVYNFPKVQSTFQFSKVRKFIKWNELIGYSAVHIKILFYFNDNDIILFSPIKTMLSVIFLLRNLFTNISHWNFIQKVNIAHKLIKSSHKTWFSTQIHATFYNFPHNLITHTFLTKWQKMIYMLCLYVFMPRSQTAIICRLCTISCSWRKCMMKIYENEKWRICEWLLWNS